MNYAFYNICVYIQFYFLFFIPWEVQLYFIQNQFTALLFILLFWNKICEHCLCTKKQSKTNHKYQFCFTVLNMNNDIILFLCIIRTLFMILVTTSNGLAGPRVVNMNSDRAFIGLGNGKYYLCFRMHFYFIDNDSKTR